MKATNDKKVDLAKEILTAYIANVPKESITVDAVCDAARRIFATVDELLETEKAAYQAGFRP